MYKIGNNIIQFQKMKKVFLKLTVMRKENAVNLSIYLLLISLCLICMNFTDVSLFYKNVIL